MREDIRNDEIEIDLWELLGVLLSKAWIIVISTFIVGTAAFLLSSFVVTPKYVSTTSVYILHKATDNASITYSDAQLASQLTKDYEVLIKGRTVLEQVMQEFSIDDEDYEAFSKRVTVENSTDTRIISITVKDEDPIRARCLADRIREIAAMHIKQVTDVEAVNVADAANLPMKPSSPGILKWTAVGAVLGMFLSSGIIIISHLMDDTIKSSDEIEKYLGMSTLALIPEDIVEEKTDNKKKKGKKKTKKNKKHGVRMLTKDNNSRA